jgi:hypothetical protein
MKRAAPMRKLLVLLILGTVLWSGYWVVGSNAVRKGAEDFFANAAAQGLVAEKTALTVKGFPNRFDLTVNGLRLMDPATGTAWEAPFAQVFAMTWKPWHIIAALPPEQAVLLPDQAITLTSEGLRASVRAKPATDLPLAAVIVESGPFSASSTAGWTVGAARAVSSISADEEVPGAGDQPNAYILSLDITDLAPDPAAIEKIVTDAGLPATVAVIKLLATATTTAPLDRFAGDTNPRLAALDLTEGLITWGDLSISAEGVITPDDQGFASGRIEIAVTNYQRLVPALVAAGAIKPEISQTVGNMLDAMAKESGDPNLLQLPLILKDGRVSLGPLPLGDAPLMLPPSG